ncbi:MAG: hypothetical protein IPP45_03170 [Sphingomonadales bacterium]|nr:hypothetical protein [Sphingomonadales bacterium]
MRSLTVAIVAVGLLGTSTAGAQDNRGSGKAVVDAFATFCLENNASLEAIAARADVSSGWTATAFPSDISTKDRDFMRAWTSSIDGFKFELFLARYPTFKKMGSVCLLRAVGPENFYPYFDHFKDRMKAAGLGGKEVNIPHLYRASGKLADGRQANAILNTRTPMANSKIYTTLNIQF